MLQRCVVEFIVVQYKLIFAKKVRIYPLILYEIQIHVRVLFIFFNILMDF